MNYQQGIRHMLALTDELKVQGKTTSCFGVGSLLVSYPGYKKKGDYRLSENGIAPKHIDIVNAIYRYTDKTNLHDIIIFLEDMYINGLLSNTNLFQQHIKEKLFWITLQEEINYPQPQFAGRKLPYQRYFEAALAKLGICSLQEVYNRTNNHGKTKPVLYVVEGFNVPLFYK